MTRRARRWRVAACLLCVACAAPPAPGVERLGFSLDSMQGEGWRTGAVRIELDLAQSGGLALRAHVAGLALPPPLERVRSAELACDAARSSGEGLSCSQARLSLGFERGGRAELVAGVSFEPTVGELRVDAPRQAVAGGWAAVVLRASRASFELSARFGAIEAREIGAALGAWSDAPVAVTAGRVSGEISMTSRTRRARIEASGLAVSEDTGLRDGEGLDVTLMLDARARAGGWDFESTAELGAGAVYLHPVLLDVPGEPLRAQLEGRWTPQRLEIARLGLSDPGVAVVSGTAELSLGPASQLESLKLSLAPCAAAPLYARYLRALAGAGALSALVLDGGLSAEVDWRRAGPASARLTLDAVDAGDEAGRFALLGLDGELRWAQAPDAAVSRLTWRDAQLYSLGFGAGVASWRASGREARLLAPVEVPLLDGRLKLEHVDASGLGLPGQRIEAGLSLTPLSLERLSERLAWLPLSGSVSGTIPPIVYTDRRVAVEGDVDLRLFGGRGTVSGLVLEDPFGVVPRLVADLTFEDIDLSILTRAMSFGRIEGLLEGRVSGLVLERWQPVAFDAKLQTPPGDRSRHRISQRALDNLASLGGANAVLASTFLRFFESFSYERLGLSCRLQGGVCEMGGVEPAARGYYIVKGGGLPPRADVVGFNDRVDWATLLERLRAVASAEGPVVR